jgi:hypothetical protein
MATTTRDRTWSRRTRGLMAATAVILVVVAVLVVVAATTRTTTVPGRKADAAATTTNPGPTTTTTIDPLLTTTSTTAPPPPITLSALEAAVVARSGLGAGTLANCGPAPTGLGVGAYIACGLDSPSGGITEEILQMTGTTASAFNVVIAPGSALSCRSFNSGELAAWTAQDQQCDQSG